MYQEQLQFEVRCAPLTLLLVKLIDQNLTLTVEHEPHDLNPNPRTSNEGCFGSNAQ